MIKAVLFDLDGTLLPMDQDKFINGYFSLLASKAAERGYGAKELVDAVWLGTAAMIKNDGRDTGENVFWRTFRGVFGERADRDREMFDDFYSNDFEGARAFCSYNPAAAKTVRFIRDMGYRTALATNPVFPRVATYRRIGWAGLDISDFELITTYENTGYCKPNTEYYKYIANALCLTPQECLMVGNDTNEDMVAQKIGMSVFLLTDCLINKGDGIEKYPHGSFFELREYINGIGGIK